MRLPGFAKTWIPLSLIVLGLAACGSKGDGGGKPQWFTTCGDPVCSGYVPPADVAPCTTETAGDPCPQGGLTCDPKDGCNRLLTCAREDPTLKPGGCPISRKRFKRGVEYLTGEELRRYHDEIVHLPLATYQYKAEPAGAPLRLGFLIDDTSKSAAVLPNGEQVDLYGYTSMSVAALQVQEKEIEELRGEVSALKRELIAVRESVGSCK